MQGSEKQQESKKRERERETGRCEKAPSGSAKGDRADALGAGELVKSQDAAVIALDPPRGRERGMSGRRGALRSRPR